MTGTLTAGAVPLLLEVLTALVPLLAIFLAAQFFILKLAWRKVLHILVGMLLSLAGLFLFLQGVKVGFMPAGFAMGEILGNSGRSWVAVPVGLLLGFTAALAEPAVRILSAEIERSTGGSVRQKLVLYAISTGVALFVALGMLRILLGLSLYWILVPGYLAALLLIKLAPPGFVGMAFDSGGVATGPMTVTFVMAVAVGLASALEGREAILDGFGLIALVALAPILLVLLLGIILRGKE